MALGGVLPSEKLNLYKNKLLWELHCGILNNKKKEGKENCLKCLFC